MEARATGKTHTNEAGETLYAIAAEGYVPRTRSWVVLPITHLHAPEEHIARFRFLASVANKGRVRIIALAPAVGFHVDENGEGARS